MMNRRRILLATPALLLFVAGVSPLVGCDPSSAEVGSAPKISKSKAELLKEMEAQPEKKKRGRTKG